MDEAIKAMPAGQTQFTMFYDRHGFARKNLDIELMKAVIKVLGDNYPEVCRPLLNPVYRGTSLIGKCPPSRTPRGP